MNTLDLAELRRLAEAARDAEAAYMLPDVQSTGPEWDATVEATNELHEILQPAVALALIARVERAEAHLAAGIRLICDLEADLKRAALAPP